MAALHRGVALGLGLAAIAAGTSVTGQALARLHVRSMVLSIQPQRANVSETLRLVLRVHLDERVGQLDNVTLPDLTGFDVLGDERRCVPARRGTDCSETLSLSPNAPGTSVLGPVWLDAKDAGTGKPMRYGSNSVRVAIAGSPAPLPTATAGPATGEAWRLLVVALAGFAVAIAALLTLAWLGRRKPVTLPPFVESTPPPAAVVPPAPDGDARWRLLVGDLREHPSRDRVLIVRALLRTWIGARSEETLADLEARSAGRDPVSAMEALRWVERAAFIDDARVPQAVQDALPALERVAHP